LGRFSQRRPPLYYVRKMPGVHVRDGASRVAAAAALVAALMCRAQAVPLSANPGHGRHAPWSALSRDLERAALMRREEARPPEVGGATGSDRSSSWVDEPVPVHLRPAQRRAGDDHTGLSRMGGEEPYVQDEGEWAASHRPGAQRELPPLARNCFDGGESSAEKALLFPQAFHPMPPMTLFAEVQTRGRGGAGTFLGWGSLARDRQRALLSLRPDGGIEFFLHDGIKAEVVGSASAPNVTVNDGQLHSVAVVREGGGHKSLGIASLYVDGAMVGEGFFEGFATNLQQWATSAADGEAFEGEVRHVRVFNAALTQRQLQDLGGEPCAVGLRFREGFVHSNLGGLGPDAGEQALRFMEVAMYRGIPLDLVVRNDSVYEASPEDSLRTGVAQGGLARIALMGETPLRLDFRFMARGTNRTVEMDGVLVSFFQAQDLNSATPTQVMMLTETPELYWSMQESAFVEVEGSSHDLSLTVRSKLRPGPGALPQEAASSDDAVDTVLCTHALKFQRRCGFHIGVRMLHTEGRQQDLLIGGGEDVLKSGAVGIPL